MFPQCNIVGPADHGNPVAANLQMAALLVTGAVLVIAAGGVVAGHCSRMKQGEGSPLELETKLCIFKVA